MFDMGFWEMGLIFIILLLVVGPDRLPGVIRTVGLWVGKARRIVSSVRHEVEQELRVSELRQSIDKEVKSSEFQRLADQVKSINSDLDQEDKAIKRETRAGTSSASPQPQAATAGLSSSDSGDTSTAQTTTSGESRD